ncbi:MAG: NAD-dependent epimerase/dehydratase family protein [Chthoniobacterales bacterium]
MFLAGCGYTGERCADFFCEAGWDVTALVSSEESASRLTGKPYRVIAADAANFEDLRTKTADCAQPDVLVHCLSGKDGRNPDAYRVVYCETLRNLIDLLRPKFTVFTSSTSVYAQNDASEVDETSPVGDTPTGDVLVSAEQITLDTGGAAVRLGGIYGPGRARFIESARANEPLPFGSPDAFINLIHRDDAARALFHVGSKRLPGLYNAVDDHPARRADLAESIRSGNLVPSVPDQTATGKRVQNAKLKSTGWTPQYPSVLDAIRADAV